MAQVSAENYGTNTSAIVGKQTDFDTQVNKLPDFTLVPNDADKSKHSKMRAEIVEFQPPMTLQPFQGFYRADRYKGSPSPDPMVPGMKGGGGDVNFFVDPHTLAFWLGELLMYDAAVSKIGYKLPALTDPLQAAATYTSGTALAAIAAANQPGQQIEDDSPVMATKSSATPISVAVPAGLRAAQLIFTFGGTATGGRTIVIVGKDHNDVVCQDTIRRTDITTAVSGHALHGTARIMKSSRWFKEVTKVTVTDTGSSPVSSTLAITGTPETYFHRLNFTKEVNEGLTIEVHEGDRETPVTYAGAHIAKGALSLEADAVARAMFQIASNRAFPRQGIDGSSQGVDLTMNDFTRVKPNLVPDWGISWEIVEGDGVPSELEGQHRLAAGSFLIDNMLGPPRTRYAETQTYPKSVRRANRDLMLALQVDHHKDLNFDQCVGGDAFESIFCHASKPFGKRYQAIQFRSKNSQLVAFPNRPILDFAEILVNLMIRMNIGNSPTGNDEAEVEIFNDSATL